MVPLRAIPSLLVSITVLAVVACMVFLAGPASGGGLYADPPSQVSTAP